MKSNLPLAYRKLEEARVIARASLSDELEFDRVEKKILAAMDTVWVFLSAEEALELQEE